MRLLIAALSAMTCVAGACGNTSQDAPASDTDAGTDVSAGASSGSGGSGAGTGGSGGTSAGASAGSAGLIGIDVVDTDVIEPPFDALAPSDAGLFDCNGCSCDGTTHYCLIVSGGAAKPNPPPAPCVDDASFDGCTPLPASCNGAPDCACLPSPYGGACFCEDAGGGLRVVCALP